MAYDGYLTFGGVEIANLARVQAYGQSMGLEQVWIEGDLNWLREVAGADSYNTPSIDNAPWIDENIEASAEFGGMIILSAEGIDASSRTSNTFEYTDDGGNAGRLRQGTKTTVFTAALVASTERGAEYGLRWIKRALRNRDCVGFSTFCSGQDMVYLRARYQGNLDDFDVSAFGVENLVYQRNVVVTRGPTVTRKRVGRCDTVWTITFTAVAGDPYEYGVGLPVLDSLGILGDPYFDPYTGSHGSNLITETDCPVAIWTPFYDPLYPAATPPPAPPDYFPDGWYISPGSWERFYAEIPEELVPVWDAVVPIVTLEPQNIDARMIRVRAYDADDTLATDVCTPLWEVIVSYIPQDYTLTIDGVQRAVYVWDGVSENVRRAESLAYGTNATPVQWPAFSCGTRLRFTLEQAVASDDMADIGLSLSLHPRGE